MYLLRGKPSCFTRVLRLVGPDGGLLSSLHHFWVLPFLTIVLVGSLLTSIGVVVIQIGTCSWSSRTCAGIF
ncbi:hypothetical protein BO78DRAFT_88967 [Aspergillus sclerotiicarbonarius CBS 121057]|uniref:Uncharacterized protein n=1 Tax=Aspergillus sclerotiicarbonarius (strain CBS 121057 / IBT 28362) TaxID=1448318 RepID=A0A319ETS6_ASPSB|nr:hypothetical protein BO78DRAFT_88967 [Aspergillus sclerotiicarbonarius CBS 121057]